MNTSKIIRGIVNSRGYTITSAITQWDYGYVFVPEFEDLPATYRLDFSNDEHHGTALPVYCGSEGGEVPEELIDTGKDIFVWFFYIGDGFGKSEYKWQIPNKCKPKTAEDEPSPSQQSAIDQAIAVVNEAVEQAQEAQQAIEDMSVSATTLAEGASATVTKTEQDGVVHLEFGIPKGAKGDTPTITASKTGKTTSIYVDGSEVAQIEDGTDGIDGISPSVSVTDITGGHRVVITDKDGTESFDVEDGATGATPNLTIGTVETLEPTESATASITGTPENPVLNLGIPQGDTGEVSLADLNTALMDKADVITDTASGSIASFTDGADNIPLKSLIVDINPIQDLHGQDAPYPAGGGKNLIGLDYRSATSTEEFSPSDTVDLSTDEYYSGFASSGYYRPNNAPTNISIDGGNASCTIARGWYGIGFPIAVDSSTRYSVSYASLTGALNVAFYDNQSVYISASSISGTFAGTFDTPATAAYAVITLTSGTVGDAISVTKLQVEKGSSATSYAPYENLCPISGWTEVDVEQRGVNLLPGIDRYNQNNYVTPLLQLKANVQYTVSFVASENPNALYLRKKDEDDISLSGTAEQYIYNQKKWTFTPLKSATYLIQFYRSVEGWNNITVTDPQLELGSTATPYSPYTGRSITIDLGQTVYGGHIDVLSGVMTVFPYYASYNGETLTGEWISDRDAYAVGTTPTIGAQVVNIGASGVTVQLEPHEVASLYGVNNIWADSGDTEVEYRADTKLFIERLTAPDSADMIADANITSGKYFMVGNSLYKATANIANGSAIVVGTNCIRKSLSEALNEINA